MREQEIQEGSGERRKRRKKKKKEEEEEGEGKAEGKEGVGSRGWMQTGERRGRK